MEEDPASSYSFNIKFLRKVLTFLVPYISLRLPSSPWCYRRGFGKAARVP